MLNSMKELCLNKVNVIVIVRGVISWPYFAGISMATQHDTTLSFQVKETIYALTVKGSCFTATHSAPENFTKLLKVVAVHL